MPCDDLGGGTRQGRREMQIGGVGWFPVVHREGPNDLSTLCLDWKRPTRVVIKFLRAIARAAKAVLR